MFEDANVYDLAAARYRPRQVNVLFVAEAPPTVEPGEAPRYFYFTEMTHADWLFRGLVKALGVAVEALPVTGGDKVPLLTRFQEAGYFLTDVAPGPLPISLKRASSRKRMDYLEPHRTAAVSRIELLAPAKVVLIVAHVYRLLAPRLRERGVLVPQRGPINFPASGQQGLFAREMAALKLDGI